MVISMDDVCRSYIIQWFELLGLIRVAGLHHFQVIRVPSPHFPHYMSVNIIAVEVRIKSISTVTIPRTASNV